MPAGACLASWFISTAAVGQTSSGGPVAGGAGTAETGAAAAFDTVQLSEVIVTATKTGPQDLQKTPVAVSVVGGALLEQQDLNNLQDIVNYVPNMSYTRNVSSSIISLRGIGSSGGSSVTTQVDGVYIASDSGLLTDFLDVGRLEVLRGPQGTLYGRNATGGTINITSQQPSSQFGGRMQVVGGNYGTVEADGYVTGPISGDTVTGSAAATYRRHDPYFENYAPGGHDIDNANIGGVRLQLRVAPFDGLVATTRADYSTADQYFESYDHLLAPFRPAPIASSLVGSYGPVALDYPQKLRDWIGGISEDVVWSITDALTLRSISAWRQTRVNAFNDNDATELKLLDYQPTEDNRQLSQEFDLSFKGDRLKGVVGLYYFNDIDNPGNYVQIPPSVITPAAAAATHGAFPDLTTHSAAGFAQGDYEIVSRLKAIVGLRYTVETNSIKQDFTTTSLNPARLGFIPPGFPINYYTSRRDHAVTPKFGFEFQAADEVSLYATATRGFKSGGFNGEATSAATAGYAPELIWSYEAGAKTEWFDHRVRLNLSAFYYNYTDLQVRQLLGPGNSVIGNAATAIVKGLELEAVVKPARDVQLSGNVSYLSAKYENFPAAAIPGGFNAFVPDQHCVAGVCTINVSGNYLNDAPRYSGLVAFDYSPRVGGYYVMAHVDVASRSRTYFDPSNVPISSQAGYTLVNGNLGFGTGVGGDRGWTVQPYVKNATNTKYYLTISGEGLVPGAIVGDPRTYGVRVGYNW
jgi:iron complex outermembrane receptor protein